jgi:hypothetical protein
MDDHQFFSGSKPNLINSRALKNIEKILNNTKNEIKPDNHLIKLYQKYIYPNLFGILVFIIFIVFIFIRYLIKQNNNPKNREIDIDESDIETDIDINIDNNDKLFDINHEQNIKNNIIGDVYPIVASKDTDSLSIDDTERTEKTENKSSLTELNEEYNRMLRENDGQMSQQMIKDLHKKKSDKILFNEMSRIIVQGGADN